MSNYNKVKTEGKNELKKLDMWNRLLLADQMVLERVLEIHAENIKKAVEEDFLKRYRDGEMCLNCGLHKEYGLTDLCDKCLEEI